MKHTIETRERSSHTGEYVICTDCGRTANTEERLEQRPCKDGISVKE